MPTYANFTWTPRSIIGAICTYFLIFFSFSSSASSRITPYPCIPRLITDMVLSAGFLQLWPGAFRARMSESKSSSMNIYTIEYITLRKLQRWSGPPSVCKRRWKACCHPHSYSSAELLSQQHGRRLMTAGRWHP